MRDKPSLKDWLELPKSPHEKSRLKRVEPQKQEDDYNQSSKEIHQKDLREVLKEHTPEKIRNEVKRLTESLEATLYILMQRTENNTEVLELLDEFLRIFGGRAWYGKTNEPIPKSAFEDIRAVLAGAAMALNPQSTEIIGNKTDIHKFVELVERIQKHI